MEIDVVTIQRGSRTYRGLVVVRWSVVAVTCGVGRRARLLGAERADTVASALLREMVEDGDV